MCEVSNLSGCWRLVDTNATTEAELAEYDGDYDDHFDDE